MRISATFLRVCLTLAAFVSANPARAVPPRPDPVPSLDLRGYRPSTDPAAGLFIEPVSAPAHGDTSLALVTSYAFRPIAVYNLNNGDRVFDVIKHQLTGDLVGNIGVLGRMAFGVDLPFIIAQTGDTPRPETTNLLGTTQLPARAFGDVAFTTKFVLVKPTGGDMGGFALALHDSFTLPTGDRASFMGEGHVTNTARLLTEMRFWVLGLHAAAGVKLRAETERFGCANIPSEPVDECPTRVGHEFPFALGLSFRPQALGIDPDGRWTVWVESQGRVPLHPGEPFRTNSELAAFEVAAGARVALKNLYVAAGLSTGIQGVGAPLVRAMLTLGYAPRKRDIDKDGIPDEYDQCRELPEDLDGFEDLDGCPDGDNDNDGVPDDEDRCPKQKEDEDGIDDDDGCPERKWGT